MIEQVVYMHTCMHVLACFVHVDDLMQICTAVMMRLNQEY